MNATWHKVKQQIHTHLPANTYSLWIHPLTLIAHSEDSVTIGCPNKFSRNWVQENHIDLIKKTFLSTIGSNIEIILTVQTPDKQQPPPFACEEPKQLFLPHFTQPRAPRRIPRTTAYTFDRFIVGPSNEFAYSASNAMASSVSADYRTLLMLSATGLGKTHLAHAVGVSIQEHNPDTRVYYITAEDFANEMITSLKQNRIEEFKTRYRKTCDVLLLEEINFLSGKDKIQTELGYTLDALANDHKKIIFTSSLPPKDIPRMSKELSSRFTSGLVSTIHKPDYHTRVKILTKKSEEQHIPLSAQIIDFLAMKLKRDVRQMESALTSLKAKSQLLNTRIDLPIAKEIVDCLVSDENPVTSEDVKQLVAKYFNVDPDMLRSKSRKKIYATPRNMCAYLSRRHTDETLHAIAKTIDRSHSTVLYASELIEHKLKTDSKLARQLDFLSTKIEALRR